MRRLRHFLTAGAVLAVLLVGGTGSAVAEEGDWLVRARLILISPDDSASDQLEGLEVDSDFTVEVDITRFFTENVALELIVASAAHALEVDELSLGSVNHLPPTVLVQWHFIPDGDIRPYVGGGINYTIFYEQSGFIDELELDDSFGFALQAGVDIMLGESTSFNVDLKTIGIETDVKVGGSDIGTVTVDPWVLGFGIGHRW